MSAVATSVPDAAARAAITALADAIEAEDGAPPLSDDALTHLDSRDVEHFTVGSGHGYAQRRGQTAEVAARPEALPALLDAIARPGLLIWSHGKRSRLAPALRQRGARPTRELHQLRRPLRDLPDDPPLPDGVRVRAFVPGSDEQAWLAVNAAAFETHPEQGRRTLAELRALMAADWFDPAGFLLAERDGTLLGFHWTKVHADGAGEVYVLGIGPAAQGLGLGGALLIRGLRYLQSRGCPTVLLYVDGDNAGAMRLYERYGFARHDLDIQWEVT